MRHRRKFNHLSRTSAHRKAMLANMASSLILHKRIKTTLAKAKALRSYVEPLITKSKDDSTHSRRMVFRYLQNKDAVKELFREVSVKVGERPGGYTRILKLGPRMGDNAEMCLIELVDFNEYMLGEKDARKAKTTRRGRRGGKKTTGEAAAAVAATATVDEVVETVDEVAEQENKIEDVTPAPAEAVVEEKTEVISEEVVEPVKEVAAPEPAMETPAEPEAKVEEVKDPEPETKAEEKEETPAEPEAKTDDEPEAKDEKKEGDKKDTEK